MGAVIDYIFKYDNKDYINIVGNAIHYKGGEIKPVATESTFEKIKSRYINAVKQQLKIEDTDNNKPFLEIMSGNDEEVEKILLAVQQHLADEFNKAVENFNQGQTLSSDLISATKNLRSKMKNLVNSSSKRQLQANASAAHNALDALFNLAMQNPEIMELYNKLTSNKKGQFVRSLKSLMGYYRLNNKIKEITKGQKPTSLESSVRSLLSQPTEFFPNLIDAFGKNTTDKLLLDNLRGAAKGTHGKIVVDQDLQSQFGITKAIKTQAADSQFIKRKLDIAWDSNPNVKYTFEIAPFVTTKTYETKQNLHMVGHSTNNTSNSILLDVLHQIYGNTDEINYQLYNSLAFKDQENKGVLNQNFRVIRSDLTANLAEKFIVGFTSSNFNQVQSLLIYNGKAYPILAIIAEIVRQGQEAAKKGRAYGNFNDNDLFRVNIVSVGNKWIGTSPNLKQKQERVEKVINALTHLKMQGVINTNALTNLFSDINFSRMPGITIIKT